jgi:integrase
MGSSRQYDGVRAASASTVEIDFYYAGQRCRERISLEPTPANLKRAAQHRAAILDAIARGVFDYAVTFPGSKNAERFAKRGTTSITVAKFLDDWLERKTKQIKISTADDYRKTINGHLVPAFGRFALPELKRADIRAWCAQRECSNKRIANILSVLRSALDEAAEDELIESNPIARWTYTKKEGSKEAEDVDPFSTEEQTAILGALQGQARNIVQFAFWSGMRTSELVALEWRDIDWRRCVARVRRAITQASARRTNSAAPEKAGSIPETGTEQEAAEGTKTVAGRREVKLLAPALQALEDQKRFTFLKGAEVFQNPRTGERWTGDQPIRKTMWAYALQRARVRYRRPYQTRHTYASMMLSAGEHPMWVAQQMGHKDWGMIRRVYGRFIPDADRNAGGRAVATFGQHLVNISPKPTTGAG